MPGAGASRCCTWVLPPFVPSSKNLRQSPIPRLQQRSTVHVPGPCWLQGALPVQVAPSQPWGQAGGHAAARPPARSAPPLSPGHSRDGARRVSAWWLGNPARFPLTCFGCRSGLCFILSDAGDCGALVSQQSLAGDRRRVPGTAGDSKGTGQKLWVMRARGSTQPCGKGRGQGKAP